MDPLQEAIATQTALNGATLQQILTILAYTPTPVPTVTPTPSLPSRLTYSIPVTETTTADVVFVREVTTGDLAVSVLLFVGLLIVLLRLLYRAIRGIAI